MKIIKQSKFNPNSLKLKKGNRSGTSFSEELKSPANEGMFNKGAFNNHTTRNVSARKGASIRRPINMNNMASSKIRMRRFTRARAGASITGGDEPGVPDGTPYTLFGGFPQSKPIVSPPQSLVKPYSDGGSFLAMYKKPWESLASNPQIAAPKTTETAPQNNAEKTFDNQPYVNLDSKGGLPGFIKRSMGGVKSAAGVVSDRANEIGGKMSIYDKASLYSVGAAAFNAMQPLPQFQKMKRVSLSRVQYDDTANKLGEQNIAQQAQQTQSGFNKTAKGIGSLMGVTASVNKNTIEGLNTIAAQRSQGIAATANANAQIAGQENMANTEIANQETLTNEQLRAQSEQLKAQAVKSNLDSAVNSQFQEKQLNMQQQAVDKQAAVQKASLSYMAQTDKWYQEYNHGDTSKAAMDSANKDFETYNSKIGNTIDSFLTLQGTDDDTKSLVEKRNLAFSEFDKKDVAKPIFNETTKIFDEYHKTFDDIGKFERGESEKFNGLSKDADEDTKKEHLTRFSDESTQSLLLKLKGLGYSESEIKLMEKGDGDKKIYSFADEKAFGEFRNRFKKEYVSKAVYEPALLSKKDSLVGNLAQYKKSYLNSKGVFEPSSNSLLDIIK